MDMDYEKIELEKNERIELIREKFKNGEIKVSLEHESYFKRVFCSDDLERKIDAFIDLFNVYVLFPLPTDKITFNGYAGECSECGELITIVFSNETNELKDFVRNPETRELEQIECKRVEDYSFEIEIPTGEILCCDRLPNSYDMLSDSESNQYIRKTLNSAQGLKDRTLYHADKNIFHVFVSNTCPCVYKKEDTLLIGNGIYDEETDDMKPYDGSEEIAFICTDLWWTSVVDVEIYKKLLIGYFGEEVGQKYINELKPISTKIKPGVYKCTHFIQKSDDESAYASMEWIREIN